MLSGYLSTQVPIPLCCNVRTNAREPVREASRSTCSIGFSASGPLAAWGCFSPSFSRLVADYHRPETPGRRLDTCVTSLICGHHMSPSTHLTALPFPSCRCHPVTSTWEPKRPLSTRRTLCFVCAVSRRHYNYQLSARIFHLVGVTTVRVRVRVSSVNIGICDAVPRLCQAMRLSSSPSIPFVFTTTSTALLPMELPRHSNRGKSRCRSSNISGF